MYHYIALQSHVLVVILVMWVCPGAIIIRLIYISCVIITISRIPVFISFCHLVTISDCYCNLKLLWRSQPLLDHNHSLCTHLQAKNSSHFSMWVSCLQEHQQIRQAILVGGVTTEPLLSPLLSSSQSALEEWKAENNSKLADVRAGQQYLYYTREHNACITVS